jgi:hypothetical protein
VQQDNCSEGIAKAKAAGVYNSTRAQTLDRSRRDRRPESEGYRRCSALAQAHYLEHLTQVAR